MLFYKIKFDHKFEIFWNKFDRLQIELKKLFPHTPSHVEADDCRLIIAKARYLFHEYCCAHEDGVNCHAHKNRVTCHCAVA